MSAEKQPGAKPQEEVEVTMFRGDQLPPGGRARMLEIIRRARSGQATDKDVLAAAQDVFGPLLVKQEKKPGKEG